MLYVKISMLIKRITEMILIKDRLWFPNTFLKLMIKLFSFIIIRILRSNYKV